METPANFIEELFERAEVFGKTTYVLSKFKTLKTTTSVVTALISRLSVIMMISMFILILNIGIALFLGEILGKTYWGFFIVAGLYLLAAIVFHLFMSNWIKKPLFDLIIKKALQ